MEYDEAGRNAKMANEESSQRENRHRMLVGLMEQHSSIMYTNAGMNQNKVKARVGIIAKANNGRIFATWSISHLGARDAVEMEAIAIRTTLSKALEENMTSLLILSDCKAVVDRIYRMSRPNLSGYAN
mgnify:CR=1 FL=1